MAKADSNSNTFHTLGGAKLFDGMGYVISEDAQTRLNQLAKSCDYLADLAEAVPFDNKVVGFEHFSPILRVLGYVADDISKSAHFSTKIETKN